MNNKVFTAQMDPRNDALMQIEQLVAELQLVMSAAARNSVGEVEQSLWRQEMLCVALQRAIDQLICAPRCAADIGALRAAGAQLKLLNRAYGSLVQQGRRSVVPLLKLCHLYGSVSAPSSNSLPTPLSCEA